MLHLLAEKGMDACLVKMPFHLALFDMNKAEFVIREHSYDTWFVGGHSMGGAMAANYVANHGDQISGVILFAAYPTKTLDERLIEISVYGTEDGILNMGKVEKGKTYAPVTFYECVIEGGNHALFGNYGEQKGDGAPTITAQEQQKKGSRFYCDACFIIGVTINKDLCFLISSQRTVPGYRLRYSTIAGYGSRGKGRFLLQSGPRTVDTARSLHYNNNWIFVS